MAKIPFNSLTRHHEPIRAELTAAFNRVLDSNAFIQGKEVAEFETEWAKFVGAPEAVGCASGTDALELALAAIGLAPGDEVITVSNTFFATVESIVSFGARPVLVDVRDDNGVMNVSLVEAAITPKTKAIIPVHLYGQMVQMDELMKVASRLNIKVIEDAAQAHGSKWRGVSAGCWGAAGCFSFFPGKNLGALGDAGAVVTNDPRLAEAMRALRNHGRRSGAKYEHHDFGWNMRMDGLQGAFLREKLKHLDRWNTRRQEVAQIYRDGLSNVAGLDFIKTQSGCESCFHHFVLLLDNRDALLAALSGAGIEAGIHYPIPCHLQPGWTERFQPLSLPVTERMAQRCLSLPMSGETTIDEAKFVVNAVRSFLS